MNCNTNLRTAIAAVLGTVSVSGLAYANDVPPTLADAAGSSAVSLYVAGSSAAKNDRKASAISPCREMNSSRSTGSPRSIRSRYSRSAASIRGSVDPAGVC